MNKSSEIADIRQITEALKLWDYTWYVVLEKLLNRLYNLQTENCYLFLLQTAKIQPHHQHSH